VRPYQATWAGDESRHAIHSELAIGVDIGGTKIAAGVVTPAGKVLDRRIIPTAAKKAADIIDQICTVVSGFRSDFDAVTAVGVGAGGWVEWPEGRVRFAPYTAFRDYPLRAVLTDALGLPVLVDNDANAAAVAELRFGSGAGTANMLMLTIGTGIGGAIAINGEIYRGSNSLAAEVGHIIVDPGGEVCGCGNRGCFETRASGTALVREGRKLVGAHPDSTLAAVLGGPDAVTGQAITAAAKAGDKSARDLIAETGYWCGVGIGSLIAVLDPAVIVLAGGVADSGELLLAPLRKSLDEHTYARAYRSAPAVTVSVLGSDAGFIGAAALTYSAVG